jgi:T5SS/PEP-CTERM-associated repeat protein
MQGHIRHISTLAGSISAALFAVSVQATVITIGTINPGTLTTNPSTTSQIIVGFGATTPGSLQVNASSTGNGFTSVTGNFSGSVGVVAGVGAGSSGTMVILGNGTAGSATLSTPKTITLGVNGGSGNLNVQNGGLAQTTAAGSPIQVGNINSSGAIQVDGANSVVKSADRIQVGSYNNSTGSVVISNGGVAQTNGKVEIGIGDNATGTVSVTGPNSKMLTNGLFIGNSNVAGSVTNTGSLTVQNGASVTANPLASGADGGVTIGSKSGSSVTVTGAGSSLDVGAITSGTNFLAGKEVIVGGYGQGQLVVDQSGSVNAAGANVIVGGGVFATQTDAGTLTVKNGGAVTADSITVYQNGLLNGGGGTINGDVTINGGTLSPGNSPGTMNINGDLNLLSGILNLEVATGISDHLNVSGNVFFAEDIIINLDFLNSPVGNAFNIADFFSNFASLVVDPTFNLAGHLNVTGLSSADFITVSLGGSSVNIGQAVAVPEPGALLLLIAGVGAMVAVRRSRKES